MALTYSTAEGLGSIAPSFELPGVWRGEVRDFSLSEFLEPDVRALVVVFMCNHCPYVVAVQDRINALAKTYGPQGVRFVGISSNDVNSYPDDSFEKMQIRAREKAYAFPYLYDATQAVAKAYGAVCTPDPFVYERVGPKFLLRYHGRLDDSWKDPAKVTRQELAEALDTILAGRAVSETQHPAMGCSIKWKS